MASKWWQQDVFEEVQAEWQELETPEGTNQHDTTDTTTDPDTVATGTVNAAERFILL